MCTCDLPLILSPVCPYSISVFEPLLSNEAQQLPEWKSWVAHVTLVTFCLQHEYRWPEDGKVCTLLVDRYVFFPCQLRARVVRSRCLRHVPLRRRLPPPAA